MIQNATLPTEGVWFGFFFNLKAAQLSREP